MSMQTSNGPQRAAEFLEIAISKTLAMQTELESYFTTRIGPRQIAQIRSASCESIPLNPAKASTEELCRGLVSAVEKSIEIQLELASALSHLTGHPLKEEGNRRPNARAA